MQRDKVLESEIISEAHGRDYSRHTLDFYQVQNLNSGKENIKGDRKPTNNDIIGKYKYKSKHNRKEKQYANFDCRFYCLSRFFTLISRLEFMKSKHIKLKITFILN